MLIATLGRKGELDRLFTSLGEQTYKKFRIFLADQNPSGYLDDMLARHSSLPITRIMLPPQGVSVARNALLEQAGADIIVFPDDDCWYAPDTLERVCENSGVSSFANRKSALAAKGGKLCGRAHVFAEKTRFLKAVYAVQCSVSTLRGTSGRSAAREGAGRLSVAYVR